MTRSKRRPSTDDECREALKNVEKALKRLEEVYEQCPDEDEKRRGDLAIAVMREKIRRARAKMELYFKAKSLAGS